MSSNPHFTNMAHMDSCDHCPHNIVQCLDANGEVEPEKYIQCLQFLSDFGRTLFTPTPEIQGLNNVPLLPRVRLRGKNKVCEYINDKGLIQMITPVMSNWYYILYISRPAVESLSFQKKFRHRFRLPHNQFLQFVVDARDSNWFPRWTRGPDATGRASSPLEVMVLGAFR